ncbi:MAG: 3-phenylpropionate/trans-cinnamate dioxygenase ferredoxin reductase component [Streptomyces sp.]|nr:3-phenylpropionate/trans-cinnamate dioxygenase ferredoxin reductase component [Streptomyces sp.]
MTTYQVTVADTGIGFPCEADQTVLDAAESAGYTIPYSCRKGVCSTCEGGLTSGRAEIRGRGPVEGPADGVLLCRTRPRSDLAIAPTSISERGRPPARRTLTVKVHRITRPTPDVVVLQLRLPTGQRAAFTAGQYLKVLLPDGDSRNYSMANPPHQNDSVQLHIRVVPGGRFSDGILPGLDKDDPLTVELPYGEFSLGTESHRPAVLLATGTGFAPVKSMVEDQLRRRADRPLHLYWGGRREEDLYLRDLAAGWAARAPWFGFTPVLSEPGPGWTGRTGWVHRAVLADHPDLAGHEVYACGSPAMTAAARDGFVTLGGLAPDSFHSDAFVSSGEPAPVG